MKEELKRFIERNIDLIDRGNFKEAYEELRRLSTMYIGEFTVTLLEADIDPAKYMNELPEGYLAGTECKSYEIPENITSIGSGAFAYTQLRSIIIPKKVEHLNPSVFEKCASLEEVILPDGLLSIGDSAFFGCSELIDIEIPGKVLWIGDRVFSWCTSLRSIKFQGTKQQWSETRKDPSWRDASAIEEVECSDGVINLTRY